jgi:putative transposase
MQRTIRIKLEPSPSQAQQLLETNRQYTAVFNAVCARGWCERLSNGVKLHHATYYLLKADYPNLVSDLHLQARVKATEAVKSALARVKGRSQSQPAALRRLPAALQRAYLPRRLGKPHGAAVTC